MRYKTAIFLFTLRFMKLTGTVTHVCVLLFVVEVWAGYFSEAGRALFRKQRECFCCCSHICWKDCRGWVCHRIGQQTHDEVFIRKSHVHKLVLCCSLESDLRSSPRGGSRASFLNSRCGKSSRPCIWDNLVLTTGLIMWIGPITLTKGERSNRQFSNLFTVANSHYQPSW